MESKDRVAYDSLVERMTTKPFDPDAPVEPRITAYEALDEIKEQLDGETDAEIEKWNTWTKKMWEAK